MPALREKAGQDGKFGRAGIASGFAGEGERREAAVETAVAGLLLEGGGEEEAPGEMFVS